MGRMGFGILCWLSCAAAWGQTTNCLVYPGGLVRCTTPQGLTSPTPSTNCQVSGSMIRCSQPQGLQPVAPLPLPQPMPSYQQPPLPYGQSNHYTVTPATSFLQGYLEARQQAQQRRQQAVMEQARLEQMRLHNQLLQQQLEMQQQTQRLQEQPQDQHLQKPEQQQAIIDADQKTVDEEQRQLERDVANGH